MINKLGLLLAACAGMLLTAGAADAQIVAFTSTSYQPAQGGRSATIAPYGTFSTPTYPNGDGGKFRVVIDYGLLDMGNFVPYAANTPGIPNLDTTAAKDVGRGGNFDWAMPRKDCNVGPEDHVRARLQRSTDGGATWNFVGTPSYIKCF